MLQQLETIPSKGVPNTLSPFLEVGEGKPQEENVKLFPVTKPCPTRVWEVKEMINKLSLYQKSATGQLVICYEKALDALCQIDKLELEKEQREAKNANKWL